MASTNQYDNKMNWKKHHLLTHCVIKKVMSTFLSLIFSFPYRWESYVSQQISYCEDIFQWKDWKCPNGLFTRRTRRSCLMDKLGPFKMDHKMCRHICQI